MVRYAMNCLWVHDEAYSRLAMFRALDAARQVGDRESEVESLTVLASTALNEGDPDLARSVGDRLGATDVGSLSPEQKMRLAEARHFVSAALSGLASDVALHHLLEAIRLAPGARQPRRETALLGNLAIAQLHRRDYRAAVEAAERAVELARGLRSPLLPWTLATFAMSLAEAGAVPRAIEILSETIEETLSRDMPIQTIDTLLASMPVALAAGQPLLAARLWGAATALESAGTAEIPPDDRTLAERTLTRVRRHAGSIDVELAIRGGAQIEPLKLLGSLPDELAKQTEAARPRLRHGEFTKREVEILTLVGQGMSDSQIAEALFISRKTASVHVANIKAKMGAITRLDVALGARDRGLVPRNGRDSRVSR
jgi:DNA-binding CsgD family transcriptional regulator